MATFNKSYSFMFMALGSTTEKDVIDVLGPLALGTLQKIDRVEVSEGPKAGMAKFFVHYSDMTNVKLRADLNDFAKRKEDGESDVQPKRIVYGIKRNGSEMYWQIFKCPTPAEREKKTESEFKPRVE